MKSLKELRYLGISDFKYFPFSSLRSQLLSKSFIFSLKVSNISSRISCPSIYLMFIKKHVNPYLDPFFGSNLWRRHNLFNSFLSFFICWRLRDWLRIVIIFLGPFLSSFILFELTTLTMSLFELTLIVSPVDTSDS